jgi:hypothetical protein
VSEMTTEQLLQEVRKGINQEKPEQMRKDKENQIPNISRQREKEIVIT